MNQFRSGAVEEPIDVQPGRGGWNESYPKTCDAGMSTNINQDISLDERQRVTNMWVEEMTYNLKVPVDGIKFVHIS